MREGNRNAQIVDFRCSRRRLAIGSLVQVGPAQQGKAKGNEAKTKQISIPPGDWPLYSRDLKSDKFSPLTQINTTNVAQLTQAWTYRPPTPPPRPDNGKGGGKGKGKGKGGGGGIGGEVTPIVVNGVMYLPAGPRVIALEADSGKEIWTYNAPGAVGNRAVGYWPGDGTNPSRVVFMTGTKMMALNASTGQIDPGFGNEGTVETGLPWGGAPYIYKNLVILGNNNGESTEGPSGDPRVYDARNGAKLWDFHTIAQPGDPGHETWLNDGWKKRAGVNTWGWYFTVDEARNLIYMPLGSAAGNYWGGDRPGANLYANCIVALDADTGKMKWYFQVVHHDLWDTDLPAAPSLFDVTRNGRKIPAMAVISKNALMFILNRETGKPIYAGRGTAGSQRRRSRRVVFAHAAVSREAPAADSQQLRQRQGFGDGSRHHARARGRVQGDVREGQLFQPGPVYSVSVSRGRRSCEERSATSRCGLTQLGRHGGRSYGRLRVRGDERYRTFGLDRKESGRRQLRKRHWIAAALRSREHVWAGSVFRFLRHGYALFQTAMGAPVRDQRQYGRYRLAGDPGRQCKPPRR